MCDKSFILQCLLNEHVKNWHTDKPRFVCQVCNKNYLSNYQLQTHMLVHTGERPFACHLCDKTFRVKGNLNGHLKSHTNERPFPCNLCDKKFSRKTHLDSHLIRHTGVKPFSCNVCSKAFFKKSELSKHELFHVLDKPFSCKICNASFKEKSLLRAHKKAEHKKTFTCKICAQKYNNFTSYRSHLEAHKNDPSVLSGEIELQLNNDGDDFIKQEEYFDPDEHEYIDIKPDIEDLIKAEIKESDDLIDNSVDENKAKVAVDISKQGSEDISV